MTKNVKLFWLWAIGAAALIVLAIIARDIFLRRHGIVDCGDGPRRTIDIRDFATQYSAYSLELEATVADKAKISTKLSPVQLQQLSESMQSANEFRKFVVAGFNSCAISKAQYAQFGTKFQALDNLARQIEEMVGRPTLSKSESASLTALTNQYGELVRKVSDQ
jgi:hypothetical protein